MRLECKRSDVATKWYDINLMPLTDEFFAVVITYGVKGTISGQDEAVLQPATSIFEGPYLEAIEKINEKVQDRISLGYVKIEPKQNE